MQRFQSRHKRSIVQFGRGVRKPTVQTVVGVPHVTTQPLNHGCPKQIFHREAKFSECAMEVWHKNPHLVIKYEEHNIHPCSLKTFL